MKKILTTFLLSFVLLVGSLTLPKVEQASLETVAEEEKTVAVVAASDFQNTTSQEAGVAPVEAIVDQIKKDMPEGGVDGLLFCGDFDAATYNSNSATSNGIRLFRQATADLNAKDEVFIKGNHDYLNAEGMAPSGANDPESGDYGVFVIHESDYPWLTPSVDLIKQTAQNLANYLNDKLAQRYDRPIFVLSHVPLAYTSRTVKQGDGANAHYIFNVLNEAGAKGLNLIFMYGHNHGGGFEDYMGGSAVYLPRGDKIRIAQGSTTVYKEETLHFTYTNPGFTGYWNGVAGMPGGLSMSMILIKGNTVTFNRYNADGKYNMKDIGMHSTDGVDPAFMPYLTEYPSPSSQTLTRVLDDLPVASVIPQLDDKSADKYVRITSVEQLQADKRYLILPADTAGIITPNQVERNGGTSTYRIGMDVVATDDYYGDVVIGQYANYHWTFEKAGIGYRIKSGGQYLSFKNAYAKGIATELTNSATALAVTPTDDGYFTIGSSKYFLQYNSARSLVHGLETSGGKFGIYEFRAAEYTVVFNDYDGTTLSRTTYAYGDAVVLPEAPTREYENDVYYTFLGWDKQIENAVTKSVTYIAQYEATHIEPDESKMQAFSAAVEGLDSIQTIPEKHTAILAAYELYENLLEGEQVRVEAEYQQLLTATEAYNELIRSIMQEYFAAVQFTTLQGRAVA